MSRSKSNRIVQEPPLFSDFKPVGVRGQDLEKMLLTLDEFEAVRLADYVGLSHITASYEMGISRSTFTRIIEQARKKVAEFIIKGKILTIEGGSIHFRNNIIRCQNCGHMFKIKIGKTMKECPACHSMNLINLAGGFGHGKYCNF